MDTTRPTISAPDDQPRPDIAYISKFGPRQSSLAGRVEVYGLMTMSLAELRSTPEGLLTRLFG